jgi:hypothetical protein
MEEATQVPRFELESRDVRDVRARINKVWICKETRDRRHRVRWCLFLQKFEPCLKDLAKHGFLAQDEVLDITLLDEV